ncbi:MAG: hypothetical protein CL997_05300 [Euryarchaeota archaeon]|nr:hypothetical protein [Euryarchaeota archaeon]
MKIISIVGSSFLILREIASNLVKCPKPTPLVGNMITQFLGSKSDSGCSKTGKLFLPNLSKQIWKNNVDNNNGKKINRQGFLIDCVINIPIRNEGERLILTNSLLYLSVLELFDFGSFPVEIYPPPAHRK